MIDNPVISHMIKAATPLGSTGINCKRNTFLASDNSSHITGAVIRFDDRWRSKEMLHTQAVPEV